MAYARLILVKLWEVAKKIVAYILEKMLGLSTDGGGVSGGGMIGFKNQVGDRIVNQGDFYQGDITFERPILQVSSGVDPRELETYLNKLDEFQTTDQRREQILTWYKQKEISSNLKDTLLIVLDKLSKYLATSSDALTLIRQDESQTDMADFLEKLTNAAANLQLDKIDNLRDSYLNIVNEANGKSQIYFETAKVYLNLLQYQKAKENLVLASQLNPSSINIGLQLGILLNDFGEVAEAANTLLLYAQSANQQNFEPLHQMMVYSELGNSYMKLNDLNKSANYLIKAIDFHHSHISIQDSQSTNLLATAYASVGAVCIKMNQLDKAQQYLYQAIQTLDSKIQPGQVKYIQNPVTTKIYNNLAASFAIQGDFEKAFQYDSMALQIAKDLQENLAINPRQIVMNLVNLAFLSIYMRNFEKARELNNEARLLLIDTYGVSHPLYARSDSLTGNILLAQGKEQMAQRYLNKALSSLSADNNLSWLLKVCIYCDVANIYCWLDNFEKAKENYNLAASILNQQFGDSNSYSELIQAKLNNLTNGKDVIIAF